MKARKVLALVLALAMVLSLVPTMAMAKTVTSPAPLFRFDLGYSGDAVAEGWIGITENTPQYSAAQGYGLTAATSYSASRTPSGIFNHAATNDFLGVRDNTFKLDIANGSYDVVLFMMETNSTALSTRPAKDSVRATIMNGDVAGATTGMLHVLTCKQPKNDNGQVIPYFTKLPATVTDGQLQVKFDWIDERDLINVYDPETDTTYAWSGVTNQCYVNAIMVYPANGSPDTYDALLSETGIGVTNIKLPTVDTLKIDFGTETSGLDAGDTFSVFPGPMILGLGNMLYGQNFLEGTNNLISWGFDHEVIGTTVNVSAGPYFRDYVYSPGGEPYYFMCDLPNGKYQVYVCTGCKTAPNVTKVEFNDNGTVYTHSSTTGVAYDAKKSTYDVEVTNELLKVKLFDDTAAAGTESARMNCIEIKLVELYDDSALPVIASATAPESITVYDDDEFDLDKYLPETVAVTLNNGETAAAPVEWSCDKEYSREAVGLFTFTGTLSGVEKTFTNDKNISVKFTITNLVRPAGYNAYAHSMEWLDRGVIALKADDGMFISWRLLASEYGKDISFNLYRNGEKVNAAPITTKTNFVDANGAAGDKYVVETTFDGITTKSAAATALATDYLPIAVQKPAPKANSNNSGTAGYTLNDAAAADVDGDGEYEIVVKWYPDNGQDPSKSNPTSPTLFDCYKLDGTILWRINLGINTMSSAHTAPFIFYDLDQDGKAEFTVRTGNGATVYAPNAQGIMDETVVVGVVGDPTKIDINRSTGKETNANAGEFITCFNGETGAIIDTIDYPSKYSAVSNWGDNYGNRSSRFNACLAYLPDPADGKNIIPAVIEARGYYNYNGMGAYMLIDGKLETQWKWQVTSSGDSRYGRGNHSLSSGDVDKDGYDEIVMGSMVVDHDGSILWVCNGQNGTQNLGHGDALHVFAGIPGSDDLQVFTPFESTSSAYNMALFVGATGATMKGYKWGSLDCGRGCAGNITPTAGYEVWGQRPNNETPGAVPVGPIYNVYGDTVSASKPVNFLCNWVAYWDGDLLSELPDGAEPDSANGSTAETIWKYNWTNNTIEAIDTFEGTLTNNSTKNNPCLSADILGDWREEIAVRNTDSTELRVYSTTIPTDYMIYTLMHDPVYRLAVTNQNTSYNQPPHVGFYLGEDIKDEVLAMELPTYPIAYTDEPEILPFEPSAEADKDSYAQGEVITVTVVTSNKVEKAYLVNEAGNGLVSSRGFEMNADGSITWTLQLALDSIGSRELKVFADGKDTGLAVSFDVVKPFVAPAGYTAVIADETGKINVPFNVTITTSTGVANVRLFSESGTGLVPSSLSFTDKDGVRTWTYGLAVGSIGSRSFTLKVAGPDGAWVATDVSTNAIQITA